MKIAMLAPVAWRTPPENYGPWELVTSLLTEELIKLGHDVTLFASGNSLTKAKLKAACSRGYQEDSAQDAKVTEYLHISNCMEVADDFEIVHNQFDFMPLCYSKLIKTPMVTTIHGFSSEQIIPIYKKYNKNTYYVSISYANRHPSLGYTANVYHGIDLSQYQLKTKPAEDYLLFIGRIHPDKGTHLAIQITKKAGQKLIIAGLVPYLNNNEIQFVGNIGGKLKTETIQNAAALLHPIDFEEPFGLSVVEAMACGTPVIAFKKGSINEIIEDKKTGFLVEDLTSAVNAIQHLSSIDNAYCRNYVKENFSKEKMAENYLNVYKNILQ